jgi:hypothetical protein
MYENFTGSLQEGWQQITWQSTSLGSFESVNQSLGQRLSSTKFETSNGKYLHYYKELLLAKSRYVKSQFTKCLYTWLNKVVIVLT